MELERTGMAIVRLRRKAGLTQKDLAKQLGISDKATSNWERGLSSPDISCLRQLCVLLDEPPEHLLMCDSLHENEWTGILLLDQPPYNDGPGMELGMASGKEPGIDAVIYDKPMIDYLLSYFLLAGVRNILIFCEERERVFLENRFFDGGDLGVSLTFPSGLVALKNTNVMLVFGKSLLYGNGLTRYFQRAMAQKDRVTVLSLMKKDVGGLGELSFDTTMRVTQIGPTLPGDGANGNPYQPLPFLFIPEGEITCLPAAMFDAQGALVRMAAEGILYAEALEQGILEFRMDSWEEVSDASNFVRLVQKQSGMRFCCLEEIARRRGLIDDNADQAAG